MAPKMFGIKSLLWIALITQPASMSIFPLIKPRTSPGPTKPYVCDVTKCTEECENRHSIAVTLGNTARGYCDNNLCRCEVTENFRCPGPAFGLEKRFPRQSMPKCEPFKCTQTCMNKHSAAVAMGHYVVGVCDDLSKLCRCSLTVNSWVTMPTQRRVFGRVVPE